MEKMLQGVHHISLKPQGAAEFEKTVAFYEGLGLRTVRQWAKDGALGAMLDAGNCIIEITSNGDGRREDGAVNHFAFATDRVDSIIESLRGQGWEITVEPKDATLPSDPPVRLRVAFCRGPVGESIEFFHEVE